jgi:hypothetical protein
MIRTQSPAGTSALSVTAAWSATFVASTSPSIVDTIAPVLDPLVIWTNAQELIPATDVTVMFVTSLAVKLWNR